MARLWDDYYGSWGLITLGSKDNGKHKRSKAYRAEMAKSMQTGGTLYQPPVTEEGSQVVGNVVASEERNDAPPPYEREEVKEKEDETQ